MIKKIFHKLKSAQDIADSYASYSDYAHNASSIEKKKIIEDAIKKANKLQKDLASSVN